MNAEQDLLQRLIVLDRLEVGPAQLEAHRLQVPYRVTRGDVVEQTVLSYKYEEPVFTPGEPGSESLAAMIGAQVALNYGLFCREIVFRGPFDGQDRRFLEEMARNTAREIFVNKLLLPNPFLLPEWADLPAVRRADYLLARLRFEGKPVKAASWATDRRRAAVLSSGGKDSLLTQGLLMEMGIETHPVFVNESGRHWYTALTAYRYFRDEIPNTARVWTNADRVFTWMLRRLPMIRQDFARLRADEYPIRLWTVAVFLFGALPMLRARGIGRLLIGDEFDTTVRVEHQGIPHYAGLYDQSRWFDEALSKYFGRKRWNVAQFSMLRPMSEMLIEKVLVERYPDLQRLQRSCHAVHIDGEEVKPCGRCEKCRRIVGMLVALGADPTACGYDQEQIERALEDIVKFGVHQESVGVQHLLARLTESGRLPDSRGPVVTARRHPEVEKLRFSASASPFDTIPGDLRAPLYNIVLQHANGAVRRRGRQWIAIDPLSVESLGPAYRFESVEASAPHEVPVGEPARWAELTWPEAEGRLRDIDVALLPVGAIEQHGPHLPVDVDAYDAVRLCDDVSARCREPRPLVLPAIPYGVSYHHDDFAGTISISPETLAQLVYEVGLDVARQGISKLVIVNAHGGNGPALHFAAQKINRDARIFTCVDTGETSDVEVDALVSTPNDVHAGALETSTTLALRPEVVRTEHARPAVPRFSSEYLEFSSRKGVGWYVRTSKISPEGVLGDPTQASVSLGKKAWDIIVRNLVELVEHLARMPLDEIYQRRY